MHPWHQSNSNELRPLLVEHYSRRRPLRPGRRFGGPGLPLYLATPSGSCWISTWTARESWPTPWRQFPSWWCGAMRRADSDIKCSALIKLAITETQRIRPGPIYTTVDLRHIRSRLPGLVFVRAGFRWHCSTRPLKRCRSQLVLIWRPS